MNRTVRNVVLIALLGVLAWFIWQRQQGYEYINYPPSATGPWVAFGDSLTEGFGATEGHDYPTVLGQRLGTKILNLGKSGETTADGLKRLEQVAELRPRVALVCFGGNDTLGRLSRDAMFNNLGQIIDRLKQEGTFVVLIGVRSASLRDQNEKGFRRLAREKQVFYVPNILQGILLKPIYMSDAIHPNDEGYRMIAERLENEMREIMEKLAYPATNG